MKRKLFLVTVALFLFNALTFAQQTTVKGKVTADDGMALPGATVVVKGTTIGTVADMDGNYTIDIEGADAVLVFSFIGYNAEEVEVNGQSTIDMTLLPDISDLDEIVVVGYGTQKKSLVTGAISKLSSEDLLVNQPQRVEQAIQGKVSGVSVASESGSPGAGMTIKIRGTSSNRNSDPLFIVDGMKTGGIDYLDPSDIESIEILKDAASAAIYGAEGGNGVVLITTKKGKAGKAQVTYNSYYGIQSYVDNLKILSGDQYVDYYQKAYLYENQMKFEGNDEEFIIGRTNKNLEDSNLPLMGETWAGAQTNWIEEITSPAPIMSHNIGISGGTDKTTYSSSVNYFSQEGITGGDKAKFERMTARLNMEHKANDWLKVGIKATYSHRERKGINENSEFGGTYSNALMFDPLEPVVYENDADINPNFNDMDLDDPQNYPLFVRDADGKAYGMSSRSVNEIINPLAQLAVLNQTWGEDKVLAGAYGEFEPIKGLKYRISYDIDKANAKEESWEPSSFFNSVAVDPQSKSFQQNEQWHTWQFDNVISYIKQLGEHNVSVMAGSHAEEYTHNQLNATGWDLLYENYNFSHPANAQNLATEQDISVSGTTPTGESYDTTITVSNAIPASNAVGGYRSHPQRLSSLFGRLSYNYGEKYMLNYTVRNDKSSMLSAEINPETNRPFNSGIFHSVSAGWVISKENFWVVPVVNFLKLRYSYGENGSLGNITPFGYVSTINFGGTPYQNASGVAIDGAVPSSLSNAGLSWESTGMHNIGVDFRLLESKISGSVEYFIKKTEGLLEKDVIGYYVGNNPPWANMGTVENKGLEIELAYKKLDGDFQYEIGGNISFMQNEVTEYPGSGRDGANLGTSGAVTRIEEGEPIYYFNGYETDGVWRDAEDITNNNFNADGSEIQAAIQPGDIKIVDQDGDGTITNLDITNIGSPHPDIFMGINLAAYYKNFDVSMNFSGAFGQEVYMGIYRNDVGIVNRPAHFLEDAWSPENPDAEFYRPSTSSRWNFAHNDQYVESGSYFKLKNAQIGYTLPSILTEKIQISRVRIYVSGNNLLTFTKYHGTDPEMGNTDGIASYGVDRGFYPQARQVLFGLQVTF